MLGRGAFCAFGCFLTATQGLRAVTPVPVGVILQHQANYFDLQHKRIRFIPRGPAAYDVTTFAHPASTGRGKLLGKLTDPKGYSWRTRLPFAFPFAGREWNELYINLNGSLTFDAPEAKNYPERDTWADGTMRLMASYFDKRALSGEQRAIVPLWGLNSAGKTRIWTRSSRGWFTVTWQAVRFQAVNEGYDPLGESVFQVRLARDGAIEFLYGKVDEKDGIVGVFCGPAAAGKLLDSMDLPPAKVEPALDMRRAQLEDDGAHLRLSMSLGGEIPKTAARKLRYRLIAISRGEGYAMVLNVDKAGPTLETACFVINSQDHSTTTDCPAALLAQSGTSSIDLVIPKIALKNPLKIEWRADTAVDDEQVAGTEFRPVELPAAMPSGFDLTRGVPQAQGNLYEIFHYPFVSRSRHNAFQEIYRHIAPEDDLAIVVTDFRIDDIHNHGASNSAYPADPLEQFGSPVLQQTAGPIYLGPRFREVIQANGRTFRNYPLAVAWVAHEMTHRWVAVLKWKPPDTMALIDPIQPYHWTGLLNVPAMYPVWKLFSDESYPDPSIMGGFSVESLPDGSAHGRAAPLGAPGGLSALDLYSMGLIGPEEVPDTFFISGAKQTAEGGYTGGDMVTVRIADILAANGPQDPPVKDAPRRFRFQIYLLHEDGREPDAEKLALARGIEATVPKYFDVATGGRMKVVPTR
jgi:hypothetical protein